MAQPVEVPRWSSVSPGTTTTEPLEPVKDTGFLVAEKPPAQTVNWLFYWIYQWVLYLQAIGTEAITWSGYQTFTGGANFGAGDVSINDELQCGSTLSVAGDATFSNEITAAYGTIAEVDLNVPDVYHTARQRMIPICNGEKGLDSDTGTTYAGATDEVVITAAASGTAWVLPVPVESGQRIVGITMWAQNVNAGDLCTATLYRVDLVTGVRTSVAAVTRSGTTRGQTAITVFSEDVTGSHTYNVVLGMSVGSNGGNVYGVALLYDRLP